MHSFLSDPKFAKFFALASILLKQKNYRRIKLKLKYSYLGLNPSKLHEHDLLNKKLFVRTIQKLHWIDLFNSKFQPQFAFLRAANRSCLRKHNQIKINAEVSVLDIEIVYNFTEDESIVEIYVIKE